MAVLYVVATPIGNLQDFSQRGIETLRNSGLIIAEDTRVTMKLCQVFDLHAPLISCHRHNEGSKAEMLAEKIEKEDLAASLVTDAGTPCISDPGNEVVRACAARGIPVLHESPFRIIELTEVVAEVLPESEMTVCCDLTKLHEKTVRGKPSEILNALKASNKTEKGEYCVVLDLRNVPVRETENGETELSLEARLTEEMKRGRTLREAQELLIDAGEKKNAVKQAAITLKKWFEEA